MIYFLWPDFYYRRRFRGTKFRLGNRKAVLEVVDYYLGPHRLGTGQNCIISGRKSSVDRIRLCVLARFPGGWYVPYNEACLSSGMPLPVFGMPGNCKLYWSKPRLVRLVKFYTRDLAQCLTCLLLVPPIIHIVLMWEGTVCQGKLQVICKVIM